MGQWRDMFVAVPSAHFDLLVLFLPEGHLDKLFHILDPGDQSGGSSARVQLDRRAPEAGGHPGELSRGVEGSEPTRDGDVVRAVAAVGGGNTGGGDRAERGAA